MGRVDSGFYEPPQRENGLQYEMNEADDCSCLVLPPPPPEPYRELQYGKGQVDDHLYFHDDSAYSSHVTTAYSNYEADDWPHFTPWTPANCLSNRAPPEQETGLSECYYMRGDRAYSSHVSSAYSHRPMEPNKVGFYDCVQADSTYSSHAPPQPETGQQHEMRKVDNLNYRHMDIGYSTNARSESEPRLQYALCTLNGPAMNRSRIQDILNIESPVPSVMNRIRIQDILNIESPVPSVMNRIRIQDMLNVESSVPRADPQIIHPELRSNPSMDFQPLAAENVGRDSERAHHSCPSCDRHFTRRDSLRRHCRKVHALIKPFEEQLSYTEISDIHFRLGSGSSIVDQTAEKDIPTVQCTGGKDEFEVISRESVRTDFKWLRPSSDTSDIVMPEHNVYGRRVQASHTEQNRSPFSTHTAESRSYSTGSSTSGTDVLDSMDGSSDDCDLNCTDDIVAEKEQILDRLMVCVYDMFTSACSTYNSCAGSGSHQPKSQTGGSSVRGSADQEGKKRKRSKDSGDGNLEDEENDGFRKRRKGQKDTNDPDQENYKLLACPYYKCNPRKGYPSKKCYGPGWDSVHRLKYSAKKPYLSFRLTSVREHLYRVHSMPLHCRRCYVTFNNEN
jgi:uncharacterized C2H2 Zn-finger protein